MNGRNVSAHFSRNLIKKRFENQGEEDFLRNQTLLIWIEVRKLKGSGKTTVGVPSPKIETFWLNMKENPWSNGPKKIQ